MNKTNRYQRQIETLTPQLNRTNAHWLFIVDLYLRLYGWSRDRTAVQEQLLSLGTDLLTAQTQGQSASEYFGNEPLTMVKAILRKLPPVGWHFRLKVGLTLLSLTATLFIAVTAGKQAPMRLGLLQLIGIGLFSVIVAWALFNVARQFALSAKQPRLYNLAFAAIGLTWGLGVGTIGRYPANWGVNLPLPFDLGLITLCYLSLIAVGFWWFGRTFLTSIGAYAMWLWPLLLGNSLLRQYWLDTGTQMTQSQAIIIISAVVSWLLITVVVNHIMKKRA